MDDKVRLEISVVHLVIQTLLFINKMVILQSIEIARNLGYSTIIKINP